MRLDKHIILDKVWTGLRGGKSLEQFRGLGKGPEERISVQVKERDGGTSLVAQWLRIWLPMQGTGVRSLVQEDPTCRGATKPKHHNY